MTELIPWLFQVTMNLSYVLCRRYAALKDRPRPPILQPCCLINRVIGSPPYQRCVTRRAAWDTWQSMWLNYRLLPKFFHPICLNGSLLIREVGIIKYILYMILFNFKKETERKRENQNKYRILLQNKLRNASLLREGIVLYYCCGHACLMMYGLVYGLHTSSCDICVHTCIAAI